MARLLSIFLTTSLLLTLAACSKQNNDEETDALPTVKLIFSSPAPDAVFTNGDVVTIKAQAISTESIHGYDLAIRQAGDATSSIYFTHIHDHNDTVNIEQQWKSAVTAPSNLEAEITLYIDHNGHTQKGKVPFQVK